MVISTLLGMYHTPRGSGCTLFFPIGKHFYFCAHWFRFTSEDLNFLTRPKVIVDWYYQSQLTEMDLICARQLLELTFVLDGSFYIQRWSDCEVYAVLTFL